VVHDEMLKVTSGPDGGLYFEEELSLTELLHAPKGATMRYENARA
jgi:hypothetical protein